MGLGLRRGRERDTVKSVREREEIKRKDLSEEGEKKGRASDSNGRDASQSLFPLSLSLPLATKIQKKKKNGILFSICLNPT